MPPKKNISNVNEASTQETPAKATHETIHVSVDFAPETKALFAQLIAALVGTQTQTQAEIKPAADVKQGELFKPQPAVEKPATESKASLTQIREMINIKAGENKTAKIVSLLATFDAKNAAGLDSANYDAFYDQLKAL